MEKYIEDYIKFKEASGIFSKRVIDYRRTIEDFCRNIAKPSDIKEKTVLEYYNAILRTKWSGSTKASKMHSVKDFCNYLMSINKLILNTKCLFYEVKHAKGLPKNIWSESELEMILSNLMAKRFARIRAIIELSYSCGLRLKEVINADLYDLNQTEKTLLIRESKCKDRLLPVTEKAILAIQDYLVSRQRIKVKTTALFVTFTGQRVRECDVQASLFRLTERFNLKKQITIHGIRHSIATHLLRRGMDIVLISNFLGHNHLTTTTIYCRVVKSDLKLMLDHFHPRESLNLE